MLTHATLLILLIFSSILNVMLGDCGDYVDTTFECLAKITCSPVCVATVEDCPVWESSRLAIRG